jgi:cold shock CspA family protein
VQATVRGFDRATRSGTVFCDDGTVAAFVAAAFDASGLRLLRPGQRVTIGRDAGGTVTRLALAGFPLPGPPLPGPPLPGPPLPGSGAQEPPPAPPGEAR